MIDFLKLLFSTDGFLRRGTCGRGWSNALIWLHRLGECSTFLAYMTISLLILFFIRRRHVRFLQPLFWLMGFFFMGCGLTHLMKLVTFWWPAYYLDGCVTMVSAVLSVAAACLMVPLTPRVMRLPTIGKFYGLNKQLQEEVYFLRQRLVAEAEYDTQAAVGKIQDAIRYLKSISAAEQGNGE